MCLFLISSRGYYRSISTMIMVEMTLGKHVEPTCYRVISDGSIIQRMRLSELEDIAAGPDPSKSSSE